MTANEQKHPVPTYLAIDLETTGLDPTYDRIIEVAIQILDQDLKSLGGCWSTVVACPRVVLDNVSDFIREMHLKSELFRPIANGTSIMLADPPDGHPTNLAAVEQFLCEVAGKFPERPILAGSSLHGVDRPFLRHWMPALEAMLSHRHLDDRTLKLLGMPCGESDEHRAADDLDTTIRNLRRGLDLLGGE